MWQYTHELVVSGLAKEQIWKVWADINHWHEWDNDIEYAKISEPFQKSSCFELKPKRGPKVRIEIAECDHLQGFTDLARFPLAKMYSIHEVQDTPNGLRVVHTIRVTGPLYWLWRKLVAQGIADGIPGQTSRLIEVAKKTR
jgi:hypothetical protein